MDMPELVEEFTLPQQPYEGPSTNQVLTSELVDVLTRDTTPEEVKTRICGYMYPSMFRTHEDNKNYAAVSLLDISSSFLFILYRL